MNAFHFFRLVSRLGKQRLLITPNEVLLNVFATGHILLLHYPFAAFHFLIIAYDQVSFPTATETAQVFQYRSKKKFVSPFQFI